MNKSVRIRIGHVTVLTMFVLSGCAGAPVRQASDRLNEKLSHETTMRDDSALSIAADRSIEAMASLSPEQK